MKAGLTKSPMPLIHLFVQMAGCFVAEAIAQESSIAVRAGESLYSCVDVSRIKFNSQEYENLKTEQQLQLDLRWQACKTVANLGDQKTGIILQTNNRVGFGLLGKDDVRRLRKHCNDLQRGIPSVLSVEEPVLGPLVAIGSADTCNAIAAQAEKNNALVVIAPSIGGYSYKRSADFALSPTDAARVSKAAERAMDKALRLDLGGGRLDKAAKEPEAGGRRIFEEAVNNPAERTLQEGKRLIRIR